MTPTSPFPLACLSLLPLIVLASSLPASESGAARVSLPLHAGWEFRQVVAPPAAAEWRTAEVPGCVHLDLLRHKLIPEPFYRDNEAKLQWIENADWEYRTTTQAGPDLLARRSSMPSGRQRRGQSQRATEGRTS